jgi:hypothetical protein
MVRHHLVPGRDRQSRSVLSFIMTFVKGLELNEHFYHDVVSALLQSRYPKLRYSAALIGYGSDVLGFDTPVSTDHNWGPRLQIFLLPEDMAAVGADMVEYFRQSLPFEYMGFPTNYCAPRYDRTQSMEPTSSYPIRHLIEVTTIEAYFSGYLGTKLTDIRGPRDWTKLDDQKLLEITSGKVFSDGLSTLVETRRQFRFFPRDVLLLRLARLWKAVQEDEPLIGRTIEIGTTDGTKIVAARIVETCFKICMYLEGKYLPYRKWLYRSFQDTHVHAEVAPLSVKVLGENDPEAIQEHLLALCEKVVEIHNRCGDLPRLTNRVRDFFNRPYKVIFAETIVNALGKAIADQQIAEGIDTAV